MNPKKYTQFGTVSIAVLLPILLFFTYKLFKTADIHGPETFIFMIVDLTLLTALLIFYKLTILIDNTTLSFKMGIGLIGKSYKISDIKSCTPVRNSLFLGFGIKMLWNGWLYNVSGLQAIELHFYSKDSIVRIGTNQPDEISKVVNALLEKRLPEGMEIAKKKSRLNLHVLIASLVVLFVIVMIYSGSKEAKVKIGNDGFTINGIYGLTIPYNEVIQIDTVASLPRISMRTNGSAVGKTMKGNFKLADNSRVKLFVEAGNPPYLLIKSKDRVPIYLNFEDKQKTRNLFKELKNKK